MHVLCAALALSLAAAGARAQGSGGPTPRGDTPKSTFTFDIGGGATFPSLSAAPRFEVGENATIGAGANLTQSIAVLAEYLFSSLPAETKLLGADLNGRQYLHTLGVSGMLSVGRNRGFSGYLIGGPAAYYRTITISQYAGTAVAPYCDPYFFYCYSVAVPVSNVLGTHDEWDFGLEGGLGIQYGFGESEPHVFIEGRYHYVFGHSYETQNGSVSSSAGFIPLDLGVRW